MCEGFLDDFAKKYPEALLSGPGRPHAVHYGTLLHGIDLRPSELVESHTCLDFLGRSDPAGVVVSALSSQQAYASSFFQKLLESLWAINGSAQCAYSRSAVAIECAGGPVIDMKCAGIVLTQHFRQPYGKWNLSAEDDNPKDADHECQSLADAHATTVHVLLVKAFSDPSSRQIVQKPFFVLSAMDTAHEPHWHPLF